MPRALNARGLPGVYFRPVVFEPTFQKHARVACGGCQIHVLDRAAFKPVLTGVALIDADARRRSGELRVEAAALRVRARQAADRRHRRVAKSFRAAIDAGERAEPIAARWEPTVEAFRELRQPFLLYD